MGRRRPSGTSPPRSPARARRSASSPWSATACARISRSACTRCRASSSTCRSRRSSGAGAAGSEPRLSPDGRREPLLQPRQRGAAATSRRRWTWARWICRRRTTSPGRRPAPTSCRTCGPPGRPRSAGVDRVLPRDGPPRRRPHARLRGGAGAPRGFFAGAIDKHITRMRAIDYPALAGAALPGQLRSGAHSDYGSLTILRIEDAPGGLQVRNAGASGSTSRRCRRPSS